MRLFLIGYMGAGKSTVGSKLAKRLNLAFYDLDDLIEKTHHQSIVALFKQFGEERFRHFEHDLLMNFAHKQNFLLSLGGGTPCFYNHMDWLNKHGTTIYLRMQAGHLASRLKGSQQNRPLLRGMSDSELKEYVTKQLNERASFYESAKITADGLSLTASKLEELCVKIQKAYSK